MGTKTNLYNGTCMNNYMFFLRFIYIHATLIIHIARLTILAKSHSRTPSCACPHATFPKKKKEKTEPFKVRAAGFSSGVRLGKKWGGRTITESSSTSLFDTLRLLYISAMGNSRVGKGLQSSVQLRSVHKVNDKDIGEKGI